MDLDGVLEKFDILEEIKEEIKKCRAEHNLCKRRLSIKTIVSSGYSDTISEGFSGALVKPYTIKQLEEVIKQTMA